MSAERIADALNQLPDDLIAETDALRQRKRKKTLSWKRVLPVAACFVLVMGALFVIAPYQSNKNAAPEAAVGQDAVLSDMEMYSYVETAAPGEPKAPAEAAPRDEADLEYAEEGVPLAPDLEENAAATASSETAVTCRSYCIGSQEPDELRITVISTVKDWEKYLAANPRLTEEGGFENTYEEAYFEENQLIAVVTAAASSSVRWEVETIRRTGTGSWELTGRLISPEWFTDDMTQQCILVELPRMVEPEDTVTLNLEPSE